MFNTFAHSAIDAVQNSKKTFVETFVKNEGISKSLNQFIDAQTEYTKSALDTSMAAATNLGMVMTSKDFYEELTQSFKSFTPAFSTKKGK